VRLGRLIGKAYTADTVWTCRYACCHKFPHELVLTEDVPWPSIAARVSVVTISVQAKESSCGFP
jgi:hypothetical protein